MPTLESPFKQMVNEQQITRAELEVRLQDKRRQWRALLDQIGPARMNEPGINDHWTMKDVVAHLTGWHRWMIERMQAAQRGAPEPQSPWPDALQSDDDISAWIYVTNRKRQVDDVLDDSERTLQQLLAIVGTLPDSARIELLEPDFCMVWIGGRRFLATEFFDHFRDEHEPDVRAWLAKEKAA